MSKILLLNQNHFKKMRLTIEIAILVILIAIGGYWVYKKIIEKPKQPITEPECEVLVEDCENINCRYYYLCNSVDFEKCVIYRCGSEIKAVTTDKNGQTVTKNREKTDMVEVYRITQACRGTTKIINSECIAGKKELKVQVETQGECPINAFVVNQGQKDYVPQLEKRDNYFYLTLENCDQVMEIIAVGTNGALVE